MKSRQSKRRRAGTPEDDGPRRPEKRERARARGVLYPIPHPAPDEGVDPSAPRPDGVPIPTRFQAPLTEFTQGYNKDRKDKTIERADAVTSQAWPIGKCPTVKYIYAESKPRKISLPRSYRSGGTDESAIDRITVYPGEDLNFVVWQCKLGFLLLPRLTTRPLTAR